MSEGKPEGLGKKKVYISKLGFVYSFVQAVKGPLYASFSRSFFFGGGGGVQGWCGKQGAW